MRPPIHRFDSILADVQHRYKRETDNGHDQGQGKANGEGAQAQATDLDHIDIKSHGGQNDDNQKPGQLRHRMRQPNREDSGAV